MEQLRRYCKGTSFKNQGLLFAWPAFKIQRQRGGGGDHMADVAYDWEAEPDGEGEAFPPISPVQPSTAGRFLSLVDRLLHYQEWRERWH
jgi:hypothetical protein